VAAAGYHKAVLVLLRYFTAEVDLVFPILPQHKVSKLFTLLRLRSGFTAAVNTDALASVCGWGTSWPSGCRASRDLSRQTRLCGRTRFACSSASCTALNSRSLRSSPPTSAPSPTGLYALRYASTSPYWPVSRSTLTWRVRLSRPQFVNQVHKGNTRVKDTLKLVLKSADQKEKASLISPEFFEWMVCLSCPARFRVIP
jgi:hypothetical protein